MHKMKNGLSEKSRAELTKMIQEVLMESTNLMIVAKHAHWNVKGPNFLTLHGLFDTVAEEFEDIADEVAERISQLGEIADGLPDLHANTAFLPVYPFRAASEVEHLSSISEGISVYCDKVEAAIDLADSMKDRGTADLLTEVSRRSDKALWLVESHLPADVSSGRVLRIS